MIKRRRSVLLLTTALMGLGTLACAQSAAAQEKTYQFDIAAEPLGQALTDFSAVSSQQIIMSEDVTRGHTTKGLHGRFTAQQALNVLLAGTDLEVETNASGVLMVRSKNAQAAQVDRAAEPEASTVETVTVTAEKRAESALNVPMGLTALSGDELQRTQSLRFEDYAGKVPGLTLIDNGAMGSQLVIRGITSAAISINSSVATYIDETPYSAEGPFSGSFLNAPNLDTFDMQRIEVLKGPQGTLYGANALGGLLKYVTNAPDPTAFAGAVAAGGSVVANGGDGFDLHAMLNVPLTDDLAFRVVGYDDYYPGYTDDPSRGLKDDNGSHFQGGRASLLYQPNADFSIRFNVLYQDRNWTNAGDVDVNPGTFTPIYGKYVQEHLIDQPGRTENQVYNVTINWNAGFANLISTTSYTKAQADSRTDDSDELGGEISSIFGGNYGLAFDADYSVRNFTQEIRLSSADEGPLRWQVGGYLNSEVGREFEPTYVIDATTKTILTNFPVNLGLFQAPLRYNEYAGFANVDYYVLPDLDVALGGRYSENDQSFHETTNGALFGPNDFGQVSSQGVFTYSGDVRWHFTPEDMLYGRIATGFVPGGPNDVVPTAHLPPSYSSSTTNNYEIGLKGSWLDGALTSNISAFLIDWHKIQLDAVIGGFGSVVNGGTAESKGIEWDLGYVPLPGLTLNFNGAYTDAYLTQATPPSVGGQVGDRLPSSPLWETSASAEYEHPLFADYSGFVGLDWRFSGSRYADFVAIGSGPRPDMPSYNLVNLRVGVEQDFWTLTFYVKNVGNAFAINYVKPETLAGGTGPQDATIYTPRTIGLELTARF
jgi:outer membrane receptor protein involved in Fe transport